MPSRQDFASNFCAGLAARAGAPYGGGPMADTLSEYLLWHGTDAPPPAPRWLTAGPLAVALEEGQLRGIWLGGRQVVQRIYGAVRDRFWNTVPGSLTYVRAEQEAGGFRVTFSSEHVSAEVDFIWRAEITGAADGTLRYVFDGEARRSMAKNRIGLCVLHPLWLAGKPCRVEYVSGDRATVNFPTLVDPMQPVRGLHDFRELRHELTDGVEAVWSFEGDVFEIEDQRNWTDASFKTYSTPQRIPMPALMTEGQRVRQTVTLRLSGNTAALAAGTPRAEQETVQISIGDKTGTLPDLGTGVAYHGEALTERETAQLRALRLAHYRVEVDTSRPGWQAQLERGLREAAALGAKAEVVLPLADDVETLCQSARETAEEFPGIVARWLILTRGAPATRAATLEEARGVLEEDGVTVGGGTDADFFQLNNNRPPADLCDFVSVPLRPCAHQFDLGIMAENLQGQREVLQAMRAIWPDKPLVVSPVSLRTRAQKGPPAGPGELPAQADVRQMSLAGAAWTVGCIKAVAESGAQSLTLFQTTGLRGIMEREGGSGVAEFQSPPGAVFPVYLVLAALADWRGAEVLAAKSAASPAVEVLALERGGRRCVLLASLTATPRQVEFPSRFIRAKVLHAGNALAAMTDPAAWLAEPPQPVHHTVALPAFATALLTEETVAAS